MNVQIDLDNCVALGVCYGNGPNGCPTVFAANPDGTAMVIETPTSAGCVTTAQANCCPNAIIIS